MIYCYFKLEQYANISIIDCQYDILITDGFYHIFNNVNAAYYCDQDISLDDSVIQFAFNRTRAKGFYMVKNKNAIPLQNYIKMCSEEEATLLKLKYL